MMGASQDVWLMQTASGVLKRFTFDAANKVSPIWSPDGHRVVYSWDPQGVLDLYEKPVDVAGNATLLLSSAESKNVQDWSADGRFILYTVGGAAAGRDVWALPLVGDRKPFEVAHSAFNELGGQFSPDGQWVAYQSNETGRYEIYVKAFPRPGGKTQISNGGGTSVQWGRDGRALFYLAGNQLIEVPITGTGPVIEAGKPSGLFTVPAGSTYVVSRNGRRFLVSKVVKEASPLTLLLNWKPK
jgi:Tol biopolymer transport system component